MLWRLLIDEDTQRRQLVSLLKAAGHDAVTVNEAALQAQEDQAVLAHAFQERRVVLTMNCRDFRALHEAGRDHVGIICVYKDRNSSKDMAIIEIIRAIPNLESSGWNITGRFVALNHWNH